MINAQSHVRILK